MKRHFLLAIPALVLSVAGTFVAVRHADAQAHPQAGATANLQGPQGPFADEQVMTPFYQTLLEVHKQGDKADLEALEAKVKAMIPGAFNGGKPVSKAMEDHVLGVAHQALAMGVSNPKMFESYKAFTAAMLGPQ